jgi:dTDP-4-amino-4,6-dideoxygalactose transaminase
VPNLVGIKKNILILEYINGTHLENVNTQNLYLFSNFLKQLNSTYNRGMMDLPIAGEAILMSRDLISNIKKRIEIIKQYSDAIQATNLKMITSYKNGNVGHLAVLRVPNEIGRDEFRSHMDKLEIQTDVHYPILDCDQVGLGLSKSPGLLNISRASVVEIVSIPLFPELTNSEVQEISASLRYFKT